jgi:hypothetical protein
VCVVVVGGGGAFVCVVATAAWWAAGLGCARCLTAWAGLGLGLAAVVVAVVAGCVAVLCVVAAGLRLEVEEEEPHALTTAVSTSALSAVRRCVMLPKDAGRRRLLPGSEQPVNARPSRFHPGAAHCENPGHGWTRPGLGARRR